MTYKFECTMYVQNRTYTVRSNYTREFFKLDLNCNYKLDLKKTISSQFDFKTL